MLAGINWNYAFLVYLLRLVAVILVALFLPNERLSGRGGVSLSLPKRFHPSVVGMFLVMVLFFIYPTNFALTASGILSEMGVTLTMVGLDVDFLLAWNRPHSGDYALDEVFDWIRQITGR